MTHLAAASLTEIGSLYLAQHYYEEAKDYYEQAIVLSEQIDDVEAISHLRFMVANAVSLIGDPAQSVAMLEDVRQQTDDSLLQHWIDLSILQKGVGSEIFSAEGLVQRFESINPEDLAVLTDTVQGRSWS